MCETMAVDLDSDGSATVIAATAKALRMKRRRLFDFMGGSKRTNTTRDSVSSNFACSAAWKVDRAVPCSMLN
jgi:hypothetical protein